LKHILVVGGAGYIGSHMVLALNEAGYSPVVFDNLSRGFSDAVVDAPLISGDLRSCEDLAACFRQYDISLVMHFAALAYVAESVEDPLKYYENNVSGTLNLLTAMRSKGVDKFVFSSTCATYGVPDSVPITESMPQRPINPYGQSKLMVEQILKDCAHSDDLKSVSLRYFNTVGADPELRAGERHDPETHLIPLVLEEALRLKQGGDPADTRLRVFGTDFETPDGTCIRDYIHVSDLCRAHLLSAERLLSDEFGSGAEYYNLGNGRGYSVLEIIEVCRNVTNQPIAYRKMPRRPGDPAELVGDARLASQVLGWRPDRVELEGIIQTAWDWMLETADLKGKDLS
jgi:UDP-glucose-4-epimerase GalE